MINESLEKTDAKSKSDTKTSEKSSKEDLLKQELQKSKKQRKWRKLKSIFKPLIVSIDLFLSFRGIVWLYENRNLVSEKFFNFFNAEDFWQFIFMSFNLSGSFEDRESFNKRGYYSKSNNDFNSNNSNEFENKFNKFKNFFDTTFKPNKLEENQIIPVDHSNVEKLNMMFNGIVTDEDGLKGLSNEDKDELKGIDKFFSKNFHSDLYKNKKGINSSLLINFHKMISNNLTRIFKIN